MFESNKLASLDIFRKCDCRMDYQRQSWRKNFCNGFNKKTHYCIILYGIEDYALSDFLSQARRLVSHLYSEKKKNQHREIMKESNFSLMNKPSNT